NSSEPRRGRTRIDDGWLDFFFRMFVLASATIIVALAPFLPALVDSAVSRPEKPEAIIAPESQMLSLVAKDDAEKKTYRIGDYTITISTHVHKNRERVALLRVQAPTGQSALIYGQVGYPTPSARFGVGKLDPSSDSKQVIVTSYSGG